MKYLKAKNDKDLVLKTLMLLVGFNLIAPNLLIVRDMFGELDGTSIIPYLIAEVMVFIICFILGLKIKKENDDILRQYDFYGMKMISIIGVIVSILSFFYGWSFYLRIEGIVLDITNISTPFFYRYIDHLCNAYFPISLSLGLFAVFATKTIKDFDTTQEIA